MGDFKDKVTFPGTRVVKATGAACLIAFDDGEQHWIPQSQIHDDSEVWQAGDEGNLVVSLWIARQKGLV